MVPSVDRGLRKSIADDAQAIQDLVHQSRRSGKIPLEIKEIERAFGSGFPRQKSADFSVMDGAMLAGTTVR